MTDVVAARERFFFANIPATRRSLYGHDQSSTCSSRHAAFA
jgi:hypothetical protein